MKTNHLLKFFVISAIAIGFLGPVRDAAADIILYGSTGNDNTANGGRLYLIDVTTQTTTLIGNTGFDRLAAIAFDNNGVLYGAAGGSTAPTTLLTIDPNTAAATTIGTIGAGDLGVEALRFNSLNTLYGGAYDANITNGRLVTIDPTNGNILTSITTSGSGRGLTPGLAFNLVDVLYGSRGNSSGHTEDVDLVDPVTGLLTPLPLSTALNPISDLSFGSDGILYGISAFGGVFSIDQSTGAETLLFNTGIQFLSGLASQPVAQPVSTPDAGSCALLFGLALAVIMSCRYLPFARRASTRIPSY